MEKVYRTELTPLAFLERAAIGFPDKPAVVHGARRLTYSEMATLATRTARALEASGIGAGDRVAFLCPNIPEMLVAHFAVPLLGAVLVAINTRLAPEEIRYILDHSGARILVGDTELLAALAPVIDGLQTVETVVSVDETGTAVPFDTVPWDEFLARGNDEPLPWTVDDEERTIAINYTSGTTGRPKGVMYTHRGAYLNALGEVIHSRHNTESVYLWTLPMFHCNGWCTTWGVTAIGGTHVCLRAVDPRADLETHRRGGGDPPQCGPDRPDRSGQPSRCQGSGPAFDGHHRRGATVAVADRVAEWAGGEPGPCLRADRDLRPPHRV